MEAVKISVASVHDDTGALVPYAYYVKQGMLQHGFFLADDYATPAEAKAAAQALADSLKATEWVSPFVRHAQIIMADYGTAAKLRNFVMSLYNGYAYPVDLSDISGMDGKHFQIVIDLMTSYHKLGENDKEFLALAERIRVERQNGDD